MSSHALIRTHLKQLIYNYDKSITKILNYIDPSKHSYETISALTNHASYFNLHKKSITDLLKKYDKQEIKLTVKQIYEMECNFDDIAYSDVIERIILKYEKRGSAPARDGCLRRD